MSKSNGKIAPMRPGNNNFSSRLLLKIMPEWITPNMISLLRLIMIPIIILGLMLDYFFLALILFICAALLDALDGNLARARGQISDWGLILDPLADKLLIMAIVAFLLLLYPFKLLIVYIFVFDLFIILAGAFKINQLKNAEIKPIKASNIWGKSKMLAQVIGVSLALLWLSWPAAPLLYGSALVLWLSLALQITSAVSYS